MEIIEIVGDVNRETKY